MESHKMRLDYNNLMREIDELLGADTIEYVQNNAWHIGVGLNLLQGYLRELAEHAIATEDEWHVEWCKNLCIVKETKA